MEGVDNPRFTAFAKSTVEPTQPSIVVLDKANVGAGVMEIVADTGLASQPLASLPLAV